MNATLNTKIPSQPHKGSVPRLQSVSETFQNLKLNDPPLCIHLYMYPVKAVGCEGFECPEELRWLTL